MQRQRVDIGGAGLEANVAGEGSPTVVFENRLATPLEEWDAVEAPDVVVSAILDVLDAVHPYAGQSRAAI